MMRRSTFKFWGLFLFLAWTAAGAIAQEWHWIGIGFSLMLLCAVVEVEFDARELEK